MIKKNPMKSKPCLLYRALLSAIASSFYKETQRTCALSLAYANITFRITHSSDKTDNHSGTQIARLLTASSVLVISTTTTRLTMASRTAAIQ